ncbi:MAG TPA: GNAT family N-acetyltransferase, partial [Thermoleophilia bacterium]|nr:GNAT family N-acetyltransferase [Thermoleophilia bacterium]
MTATSRSEPAPLVGLTWRDAVPRDAAPVAAAIDDWWPGRHMVHAVCPQLLEHLGDTCVIAEVGGELVGFLVGFVSQRMPGTGYIHYAGVRPDCRGRGVGRELYRRFTEAARLRGCTRLYAETGTWN